MYSGLCGRKYVNIGSDDEVVPFSSPGYPTAAYPNDLACLWIVSGTSGRRITIVIIDFQLEDGYDFLTIGNGQEATAESKMAVLSGFVKIRRVTSAAGNAWLQMTSDSSGRAAGFLFQLSQQITDVEGKSRHSCVWGFQELCY